MTKLTAPVLMLLSGLGLAGTASAACQFETPVTQSPFTTPAINTCGKNLSFSPFCNGGNTIGGTGVAGTANPSGLSIIQVNVGTNTGLTWGATSTTAGFNPEMALISSTCDAGNDCLIDYTNNSQTLTPITAGTAGAANPGGTSQAVLPVGTYYVILTALGGTPACGNIAFSIAGTLPVKLEKFSVD